MDNVVEKCNLLKVISEEIFKKSKQTTSLEEIKTFLQVLQGLFQHIDNHVIVCSILVMDLLIANYYILEYIPLGDELLFLMPYQIVCHPELLHSFAQVRVACSYHVCVWLHASVCVSLIFFGNFDITVRFALWFRSFSVMYWVL